MKPTAVLLTSGVFGACVLASVFANETAKQAPSFPTRVAFPTDYSTQFEVVRGPTATKKGQVTTTYVNAKAATIDDLSHLPYPDGSVIVFEWAEAVHDASGAVVNDSDGHPRKGKVVRVDVMEREKGFGEAYGDHRAGDWEFATYQPDGKDVSPPNPGMACAQCHAKAKARDFVNAGRFAPQDSM